MDYTRRDLAKLALAALPAAQLLAKPNSNSACRCRRDRVYSLAPCRMRMMEPAALTITDVRDLAMPGLMHGDQSAALADLPHQAESGQPRARAGVPVFRAPDYRCLPYTCSTTNSSSEIGKKKTLKSGADSSRVYSDEYAFRHRTRQRGRQPDWRRRTHRIWPRLP